MKTINKKMTNKNKKILKKTKKKMEYKMISFSIYFLISIL